MIRGKFIYHHLLSRLYSFGINTMIARSAT
ncbi:protein of unknown function [Magnetospirillum sp. XM-1]|nr:protein of unknown function [Magnetospirillum sp. XM-1]